MSPSLRAVLETRAEVTASIRRFFGERNVLEVDTPSLSIAAATDPALASLGVDVRSLGRLYLHTSPEHAMKRLLAAGSGDIFQIARVFRDGELGRWHQPEFLLLEWYRTGFDEFRLMDEVHALLEQLLTPAIGPLRRLDLSYRQAFTTSLDVDPLTPGAEAEGKLNDALASGGIDVPGDIGNDALLDLALSTLIVPRWPRDTAVFLYDYPASQAALATIKTGAEPVAARFEVFVNGLELGNGFRELTDAKEQRLRFEADNSRRRQAGIGESPIDEAFLDALELGLPECAGVAIGIDRLMAVLTGADSLAEVVSFPHRKPGSEPGT